MFPQSAVALFSLILLCSCGSSSKGKDDPETDKALARPEGSQPLVQELVSNAVSDSGRYAVKIVWRSLPRALTLGNTAEIYFKNAQGEALDATLTKFRLFHATMVHPSLKENEMIFKRLEIGHWELSQIYFSMKGAAKSWVVDLEASVEGQTDKARVSIDYEVE